LSNLPKFFSNARFLIVFCFVFAIIVLVFFEVFLMLFLVLFLLIGSSIDNDNNSSKEKSNKLLSKFIVWSFDEESRDFSFVLLLYLRRISTTTFFRLFLIYCVTILFIFFHFFSSSIDELMVSLGLLNLIVARRLCKITLQVLIFLLSLWMHKAFFW